MVWVRQKSDGAFETQVFKDLVSPSHRTNWFTDADEGYVTNSPTCQFIFTGRRLDPETSNSTTQMYFYRARYYSPTLGRFISRDPIDYDGGMNLYEYVGGMGADLLDPRGLFVAPQRDGLRENLQERLREELLKPVSPEMARGHWGQPGAARER